MSVSWALPKDHWRSNSPSSCCCRVRQSGSMRSTLSGRVWSAHARENFFFLSARVAVSSHPLSLRRPALSYSFVVTPPPPFGPSYRQGVATRSSSSSSLTSRDSLPLSILLHPLCHPGLVSPLLRARMEGMCFPFSFFPKVLHVPPLPEAV